MPAGTMPFNDPICWYIVTVAPDMPPSLCPAARRNAKPKIDEPMTLRTALIFIFLAVCGPAGAADATFPAGSHIGLVPPPGMTPSASFPGFEDRERKAAILLNQVPGEAYEQFLKAMSSGSINLPGVSNAKRELMLIDSGAAHLVVGDQEAEGVKFRKWLMITRRAISSNNVDSSFSFVVTAQVPVEAGGVYSEEAIRKALASAVLRADIPQQEILDQLPFRITERAKFDGIRMLMPGRAVMLTERSGAGEITSKEPIVMMSIGGGAPSQADERASFSQNVLRTIQGFSNLRLLSQEAIRISGQPGYEIRLEGQSVADNSEVVLVQWMRFSGGGFLRMIGISPKDSWPQNFMRFRQIRDGVNARE